MAKYYQINMKLEKPEYDELRQLYYELKLKGVIKTWGDLFLYLAGVYKEQRLVICT